MAADTGISKRSDLDRVLLAGREALADNRYEEAGRLLRLADESPFLDAAERPVLWLDIGAAAEGTGSPDAAASYYSAAAGGDDGIVAATAKEWLSRLHAFDAAREEAAGLGEEDRAAMSPQSLDVYMKAGEDYARGDCTGALELYTALYNAPGEVSAKGNAISGLVMCLVALGRYDEARQYIDYGRSQGAVVDHADQELRRYEAARAAVDDGVSGSEFAVVKQAAVDAFRRRDYVGAVEFFRQLLDAPYGPGWGNAEIAYNLGQCLLQLQDYDGARYYLQQADGQSTTDVNRRTQDLLQKLARLDDALAIVEPHLAP